MSVTLRLPCIVFEARVFPYGEKTPSMIEQAALAYVQSGTTARPVIYDDLDAFLSLGRPAVLELLIKLWRRGWIAIDLETSKLTLTEPLKRYIAGKERAPSRFDGLGTTEPPETLAFAYDLVCGQVFPEPRQLVEQGDQRFTYGPGPDPDRPFAMPLNGFTDVATADFTRALREHPAYKRLSRDANLAYRIVRAEAVPTPAAVQYYFLKFEVFRTPEGDLQLRSADEESVPARIGRVLAGAIVDRPAGTDPFMRKLLEEHIEERESTVAMQLSSPTFRFRALVRQIQQAGTEANQTALEDQARSLWPEMEFEVSCAASNELVDIKPLANSPAVQNAVLRDIGLGFEQAVLVSQTCHYEALVGTQAGTNGGQAAVTPPVRDYWSTLRNAVSGNGRLFLQWGADHLDDTSRQENLLAGIEDADLGVRETDRRFVARKATDRGIHTRASLLVRDFDKVLLSANPLLGDPRRPGMGIRLRFKHGSGGAERRETSHAVTALLDRLSLDFADPDVSKEIKKQGNSLGTLSITLADDLPRPIFAQVPEGGTAVDHDREDEPCSGSGGSETARRLRARDWAALAESVDTRLGSTLSAETLFDAGIYETALALVKDADPKLPLVLGLSSSDAGVSSAFLEALVEFCANAAPAALTVLMPSQFPRAPSDTLVGRLAEFRVEVRAGKAGTWMPFVLTSKGCVIGSAGLTRKIVNVSRRSTGTQVGFLLRGPGVASTVASAVGEFVQIEAPIVAMLDATPSNANVRHYRLSEIYRRWKECAENNEDLNFGVSVIEEELNSSSKHLRDMLETGWAAGDEAFLHAVLKAAAKIRQRDGRAAGAPFTTALRDFADHLWRAGDDFAAAVFADHGSLGQFATGFERELAIAFASGGDFYGSVPDDLSDLQSSDAIWALVVLLLLRATNTGLAEQLALQVDQLPVGELGSLVKALIDRVCNFPLSPLDLAATEDQLRIPDLGTAIARAKEHLDRVRSQDLGARTPSMVRDILFESGFAGDLASILKSPPPLPRTLAKQMNEFFERHLDRREYAGLRPGSMGHIADRIAREANRVNRLRAKGEVSTGKADLGGNRRQQMGTLISEALGKAYDVLQSAQLASQVPTELTILDRKVLGCADALVRRIEERGPTVPRPLSTLQETLRHRMKGWKRNAPQPAYWRYPALLRNPSVIASRDYAAIQLLILDKEWLSDSDGAVDLFRRLLDNDGFIEARHLLDIWPVRAGEGSEDPRWGSFVDDYEKRIGARAAKFRQAILDVRRRKIRGGFSSIEIEQKCAHLLHKLDRTDLPQHPEVLGEAFSTLERVEEELARVHSEEATALVVRTVEDRRERVAALAELGHLEVARVVMETPTGEPRFVQPETSSASQALSWLSMVETGNLEPDSLGEERVVEVFGSDKKVIELVHCMVQVIANSDNLTEVEICAYAERLSAIYAGNGDPAMFGKCEHVGSFWHVDCLSGGLHLVAPHLVSDSGILTILVPESRQALRKLQEKDANVVGRLTLDHTLLLSPYQTYGALSLVCMSPRIVVGFLRNPANRIRLTKRALFRQTDFSELMSWTGESDDRRAERLGRLMQQDVASFREVLPSNTVRQFINDFCFDFDVELRSARWGGDGISRTVAYDLVVHYSGGLFLNAVEILLHGLSEDQLRGRVSTVSDLLKGLQPSGQLGRKLIQRCLGTVESGGAKELTVEAACGLFDDLLLNADGEGPLAGSVPEAIALNCLAAALRAANATRHVDEVDEHLTRSVLAHLEARGLLTRATNHNERRWRANIANGVAGLLKGDLL